MDTNLFSKINTTISVKENDFITEEKFQKIIQSKDTETLAFILEATPYHLSIDVLENPSQTETSLMTKLVNDYRWAYAESPSEKIVTLFALRYVYHNIKVLLKSKAAIKKDFSKLLIPIGIFDIESLKHLVTSLHSDTLPDFMVHEVESIWNEYETFNNIRVLDVGADLAYFKHLKLLSNELDEVLSQVIVAMIDFYNIITVKRGLSQNKSHGDILQLLSDEGSISAKEFIYIVENQEIFVWFNKINPSLDSIFSTYELKMQDATISSSELEFLCDLLLYKTLDQGRYNVDGPLVLARYLLGCEFEVKNLRMIISALQNTIPFESIKERIRPHYGS